MFFALFIFCLGYGQSSPNSIPDSLKSKSYEYFIDQTREALTIENQELALYYIQTLLNKAKKYNNLKYTVQGYYYLYFLNENPKIAIHYIDSALAASKKTGYSEFDALLYSEKGVLQYQFENYILALDNYLEAKKIATEENHEDVLLDLEYSIGLVQLRIGDIDQAIKSFREYHRLVPKENLTIYESQFYLSSLYGLAHSFQKKKQLDSAMYYNLSTINKAIEYDNIEYHNKARVNEAIIAHHAKKYKQSKDSILKYLPLIEKYEDTLDVAFTYYYLGKSYVELNKWQKAIPHLKKVDTLIKRKKGVFKEIRDNYNLLYKYYRKNQDMENQLFYLEKLIDFDRNFYNQNLFLKNTLLTKYENPKLFEEKENLIEKLEKSGDKKSIALYITLVFIGVLLVLSALNYQKRLKYKKRFEALVEDTTHLPPVLVKKSVVEKKEALQIPENIIREILEKLNVFEQEEKFLDTKITLNHLAKSLGTNSNYLSKIINYHKEKNFSSYISDLRINYTIKALKEQPKLREYTIKAIAFEVGFKNAESFTKAFYRQTQLYPSYFIKQLKKQSS
ncbi:helix-turn-helix domain-containing protein [Spongiimicrobium salis]|uniref:helix-turn-helix domain-containing protein n=1 Tax=Spongiimicrobium salis TaxID=1667022 RepID=UPI00374CEC4B